MFPAKKKPDMSLILGIGKKPAPEQAPPAPGVKSAPPAATPPVDSQEQGEGDLTPEMLDYHGGEENCGACRHFTEPSTCDRWPDPVDAMGHCEGFQGSDTGDQMQAADMGEQGMGQEPAV